MTSSCTSRSGLRGAGFFVFAGLRRARASACLYPSCAGALRLGDALRPNSLLSWQKKILANLYQHRFRAPLWSQWSLLRVGAAWSSWSKRRFAGRTRGPCVGFGNSDGRRPAVGIASIGTAIADLLASVHLLLLVCEIHSYNRLY